MKPVERSLSAGAPNRTRDYSRGKDQKPVWPEFACSENNPHVRIGGDNFYLCAEGLLMPACKDQSPPDLRHFKKTRQ